MDKELKEYIASKKISDKQILDLLKSKASESQPDAESDQEDGEAEVNPASEDSTPKALSLTDLKKLIEDTISATLKGTQSIPKKQPPKPKITPTEGLSLGGFQLVN